MAYLPDLIPEKHKVLPNHFKPEAKKRDNKTGSSLQILIAVILMCAAIGGLMEAPLACIFLLIISIIILPSGHKWLERTFKFNLTLKAKTLFLLPFIIGFSIPMSIYIQKELETERLARIEAEKQKQLDLKNEEIRKQKKDSLNYYLKTAISFIDLKKTDEALKELKTANTFIQDDLDKQKINDQKHLVYCCQAIKMVESGKYKQALPILSKLLKKDENNTKLKYSRALCYSKIGKIQEAVNDLKTGVNQNDSKSIQLHDKINPIKRKVLYYETLCCDGSTSNAKGRGACSHHGGVCDWNHPVYGEYRKY